MELVKQKTSQLGSPETSHRVSKTRNVSCKLRTFPFFHFSLSNFFFWKLIKFKDNPKEIKASNKTQSLTKSINMDIWGITF